MSKVHCDCGAKLDTMDYVEVSEQHELHDIHEDGVPIKEYSSNWSNRGTHREYISCTHCPKHYAVVHEEDEKVSLGPEFVSVDVCVDDVTDHLIKEGYGDELKEWHPDDKLLVLYSDRYYLLTGEGGGTDEFYLTRLNYVSV